MISAFVYVLLKTKKQMFLNKSSHYLYPELLLDFPGHKSAEPSLVVGNYIKYIYNQIDNFSINYRCPFVRP